MTIIPRSLKKFLYHVSQPSCPNLCALIPRCVGRIHRLWAEVWCIRELFLHKVYFDVLAVVCLFALEQEYDVSLYDVWICNTGWQSPSQICTRTHARTHTHTHTHTHPCTHVYVHTRAYVHNCIRTCTVHDWGLDNIYSYTCTCAFKIKAGTTCTLTHIHMHVHVHAGSRPSNVSHMHVHVHAGSRPSNVSHMHVHVHAGSRPSNVSLADVDVRILAGGKCKMLMCVDA
jgi:hypothetical protein